MSSIITGMTTTDIANLTTDEIAQQPALVEIAGKTGDPPTSDQIAAFLADRGIVHGDRVAILSENSPHWGVAYLAVTSMGAVAVPITTSPLA